MKKKFASTLLFLACISPALSFANNTIELGALDSEYRRASTLNSDIYEHVPVLRELARECATITEIGVRSMVSTWGILKGLSENTAETRTYLGIDLDSPAPRTLNLAKKICAKLGIQFTFEQCNDMEIDLDPVDLLFIDSLHTYSHLSYELETFSDSAKKYIALHDTSPPWELEDDTDYKGNFSEYPVFIDRAKRGLWPAVEDFLDRHPEWTLHERRTNCHGFTILKRVAD